MNILSFETIKKLNAVDNRDLLSQVKERGLTGLAAANPSSKEQVIWLLMGGEVIHGYQSNGIGAERISSEQLTLAPAWNISVYPLPGRVVQFSKVLIEHKSAVRTINSNSAELLTLAKSFSKDENPTLMQIQWRDAEGLILVSGCNLGHQQAAFMSPQGNSEDAEALTRMSEWPTKECRVNVYSGNMESTAWVEAQLCLLFEWSASLLLDRYGYLTGKTMVGSVTRDLVSQALRFGRDFSTTGPNLTEKTIFPSPAEMFTAYQNSFRLEMRHIQSVIGVGMMTIILRQMQTSLNKPYQTLLQRYPIFE